jgi:hypothetical protein
MFDGRCTSTPYFFLVCSVFSCCIILTVYMILPRDSSSLLNLTSRFVYFIWFHLKILPVYFCVSRHREGYMSTDVTIHLLHSFKTIWSAQITVTYIYFLIISSNNHFHRVQLQFSSYNHFHRVQLQSRRTRTSQNILLQ